MLFGDDISRANTGHAAENLGLFRRMAYCILKQETVQGRGLASKQRKAMWNDHYVLELLNKFIKEVSSGSEVYQPEQTNEGLECQAQLATTGEGWKL